MTEQVARAGLAEVGRPHVVTHLGAEPLGSQPLAVGGQEDDAGVRAAEEGGPGLGQVAPQPGTARSPMGTTRSQRAWSDAASASCG